MGSTLPLQEVSVNCSIATARQQRIVSLRMEAQAPKLDNWPENQRTLK